MKRSPSYFIPKAIVVLVLFVLTIHVLPAAGERTAMTEPKVRTFTAPLVQGVLKEKMDESTTRDR
ncbi:MAG: hypothetical protein K0B52_05580, partial [FCB group bacterium]|nr:hypothetical protein [FCB group bacterium]